MLYQLVSVAKQPVQQIPECTDMCITCLVFFTYDGIPFPNLSECRTQTVISESVRVFLWCCSSLDDEFIK